MQNLAAMTKLTKSMCWEVKGVGKDKVNKVGVAVYQKPMSNECYEARSQNEPPLCKVSDDANAAWYHFLLQNYFLNILTNNSIAFWRSYENNFFYNQI